MLLLIAASTHATVITYGNRATFDAAVGTTTLIDFEQYSGVNHFGSSLSIGSVTFTQADSRLFVLDSTIYNTTGTSSYLNHNDGGSAPVITNIAGGAYAVGMDLAWLYDWGGGGFGGIMTIALDNGDTFNTSVVGPLNITSTQMGFLGFTSTSMFTAFTIIDSSNSVMIDNFAYSSTPAPAPTVLGLMSIGLLGVGVATKRRNRKY